MTESPMPFDPLRQLGVSPTGATGAQPNSPQKTGETSAAFRALLDSLTDKAASLDEAGKTLGAPEELAHVVDDARRSLEDAVSLSDQLLEAYRANQVAGQPNSTEEHGS